MIGPSPGVRTVSGWVPMLALTALLGPVPGRSAETGTGNVDQIRIGEFWIDRFEYPNISGQLPLTDVTWEEARQLCADREQRLCTEAEWEQASRGPDNLDYGYGSEFEPRRCNTPWSDGQDWVRDGGAVPSGTFEDCHTPAGVHDMIGNVWEWTDGWYNEAAGWRVVRGGSWFQNVNFARSDGRYGRYLTATYSLDLIGFRCCRSDALPQE